MKEEKLMILSMLEEGKITSEEAVKLLEALEEIDESSYNTQARQTQSNNILSKTLEEIGSDISNAFSSMISGLKDISGTIKINKNYNTINLDLSQNIAHIDKPIIDLKSVNGSIKVNKTDGDNLSIKVICQYKNGLLDNNKEFFKFYLEEDKIIFTPLYNNDISIKLDVYLPERKYNKIILNSTNGRIEIEDINMDKLNCTTSNGSIFVASVNSEETNLLTKNGRIELKDTISETVITNTTNARIDLKDVDSKNIICKTANGTIDISDTSPVVINLTTSNGKIILSNIDYNRATDIRLITSNGSISCDMNNIEKDMYFDLETSMGNINLEIPDLVYKINNQVNLGVKKIIAHSVKYDKDKEHIKLFASTSNGSIKVME